VISDDETFGAAAGVRFANLGRPRKERRVLNQSTAVLLCLDRNIKVERLYRWPWAVLRVGSSSGEGDGPPAAQGSGALGPAMPSGAHR
jgi:hypothetical protein